MKRTKHNLSHYKLTTAYMGSLTPVGCVEVLPGDTFQHSVSALIRTLPMNAPTMHPVQVRFHSFFVPNRLVFPEWEQFITGGADGNDATPIPQVTTDGTSADAILDALGVPPVAGLSVSALPLRCYNLIFNEYYRDQDLETPVSLDNKYMHEISWEKDYFSGARPWTQKGDEITLPIAGTADIVSDGTPIVFNTTGSNNINLEIGTDNHFSASGHDGTAQPDVLFGNNTGLNADMESATQVSINDFRKGFALQRYKEARARYGSRYTEYLRYLGIRSKDSRLQRPEYLGGGRQSLSFSEVLNTASDPAGTTLDTLGKMGGHGIAGLRTNKYRRFFEEHGHVLTLMSVRPKAMYTNGIHKMFLRETKEDYYQQELAHIGQQEILNNEVYADPVNTSADIFGYGDRYREYTEHPSQVQLGFRNDLDYWHLSRQFSAQPVLNSSFTKCIPSQRIFADTASPPLQVMVNHNLKARRMVKHSANGKVI